MKGTQYEIYQIKFNNFLQGRELTEKNYIELVGEFMETLSEASASTQKKAKSSISQALLNSTYNEIVKFKIMKDLKLIKTKKADNKINSTKTLTVLEISKLKDKATNKDRLLIEILEISGCRISEVLNIKYSHLKSVDDDLYSVRILGKGKKERTIFLPIELIDEIREVYNSTDYLFINKQGNKLNRCHVAINFFRLSKKTGININPHKLRHTFATNMVQKKESAKAVGNYLGHASAATILEMYVHETLNIKDSLRLYKKAVLMTTPSKEKKE